MRVRWFACVLALAATSVLAQTKPTPVGAAPVIPGTAVVPFSPGTMIDGTLYVSGTIGVSPAAKEAPVFEEEVAACLANIRKVLQAAGMDFEDLVSVQVFLTDMSLWKRLNVVYVKTLPAPYPSRVAVGVTALAIPAARVEISAIARKSGAVKAAPAVAGHVN